MSYPPPGGYPMYAPPSVPGQGVPYPGSSSQGPPLGFDHLTSGPPPVGGPGVSLVLCCHLKVHVTNGMGLNQNRIYNV